MVRASAPLRRARRLLAIAGLAAALVPQVLGAGKKPLFEYDDHYVMLNDFSRNQFYRRALQRTVPACGADCFVLDVGAGSGLLSMMAAHAGAKQVVAIEANPNLAALATQTVGRNQAANYPGSNVTVISALSAAVDATQLPNGRLADILVTETFGTMLLGEGAINFVPDARDRLLKPGGIVIPAGGCQYATLIEIPDMAATMTPGMWESLNLSRLEVLQDTIYWKATVGASTLPFKRLSDRLCVLEVDFTRDTKDSIPENRTFRIPARKAGTVQAVLFDWDIWADASRSDILTTAPGSRNYAGDVAWGWLLQLQEAADENWKFGPRPTQLKVEEGEMLDVFVEFIARGISIHTRSRKSPADDQGRLLPLQLEMPKVPFPARMRGVDRGDMVQASEFYLPLAGDRERHSFYRGALERVLAANETRNPRATVLDCSSDAGVPALIASKEHGLRSLTVTRRSEFAKVLQGVAEDNGVGELMESYAVDPRDLMEILLPNGERADVVVLEPPGTPVHGMNPFALLPSVRKRLLKPNALVVPAGGCLELGLVDSDELQQMFAVPGGQWEEIDLTVWNEEARKQRILERLVPYTKWFGAHSSMALTWLAPPRCVFDVDFRSYGDKEEAPEIRELHELQAVTSGRAHAIVARWVVWDDNEDRSRRLGAESDYYGRSLTWPHYVQAVAMPDTAAGVLEPVPVREGELLRVEVVVRQGTAKQTGAAGPEFTFALLHGEAQKGEL